MRGAKWILWSKWFWHVKTKKERKKKTKRKTEQKKILNLLSNKQKKSSYWLSLLNLMIIIKRIVLVDIAVICAWSAYGWVHVNGRNVEHIELHIHMTSMHK